MGFSGLEGTGRPEDTRAERYGFGLATNPAIRAL